MFSLNSVLFHMYVQRSSDLYERRIVCFRCGRTQLWFILFVTHFPCLLKILTMTVVTISLAQYWGIKSLHNYVEFIHIDSSSRWLLHHCRSRFFFFNWVLILTQILCVFVYICILSGGKRVLHGFWPIKLCLRVYSEGSFGAFQVLQLPAQMKHLI